MANKTLPFINLTPITNATNKLHMPKNRAFYVEEQVWKCAKHPSKRRRTGICPVCLQDKLASLCPDCAYTRPCACTTTSSSFSSSSYSFSCFSTAGDVSCVGTVGKVSKLIETEPALRRSRSRMIPFLRSKQESLSEKYELSETNKSKTASFQSMFRANSNKINLYDSEDHEREVEKDQSMSSRMMMRKSRSVTMTSCSGIGDLKPSTPTKGKGWYLPSPMKVLRVSKLILQQHFPYNRG